MIDAVLFDLDDTLFPQADFLDGVWTAVAEEAARRWALDPAQLATALRTVAGEGSDRGGIIDRALARIGRPDLPVAPLVETFRAFAPERLAPYPGALDAVAAVRRRVPVALVTDGDPGVQRAKLRALGLEGAFDVVVFSDELGRHLRKPDPAPFRRAADLLRTIAPRCIMVGDRPGKDVAGARRAGLHGTVRVRTGEYRDEPDDGSCLAVVADVAAAGRWLLRSPLSALAERSVATG